MRVDTQTQNATLVARTGSGTEVHVDGYILWANLEEGTVGFGQGCFVTREGLKETPLTEFVDADGLTRRLTEVVRRKREKPGKDRLSVKAVSNVLRQCGIVEEEFTAEDLKKGNGPKNVGDETYGNDSHIYVGCGTPEKRREIERIFRDLDILYNPGYSPNSATLDVPVKYFKGWHCDE